MARKKAATASESLVNVAVMAALRGPLTYRVPESVAVRPGQRVLVPLGHRRAMGIVLEPVARTAPGIKVRDVLRALDEEPLLSTELLKLGRWIADYYLAPLGEVFGAMLPLRAETRRVRSLRITDQGRQKLEELAGSLLGEVRRGDESTLLGYIASHPDVTMEALRAKFRAACRELLTRALEEGWATVSQEERARGQRKTLAVRLVTSPLHAPEGPAPEKPLRLSPVARRIVEALARAGPSFDHRELLKSTGGTLAHLRKLSQAGVVEISDAPAGLSPDLPGAEVEPELTAAQSTALEQLTRHLDSRSFHAVLLEGVTASGKTEVYLRLIARGLERGRSALMLVPEIGLTPAVQAQFRARFGEQVAVLHSGLSESERHEEWWRVRRGEARVAVGTRSAVFAPLENLGVLIVDEEHDPSYKQGETPRYHGRDVAVMRAHLANCLVVLGSATPSLESASNARQGKYQLCKLPGRIAGRPLASVEIVDMREEFRQTHTQVPLSCRLKDEITAQLAQHEQTMILLNRRGYSWFLLCRSCSEAQRCINCSISLTYHRREQRLICHYCGYSSEIPSHCPACGSEYLHYVGEGTEKLEDKLAELFPGARVARLDRDVARRAGYFSRVLGDFRREKIDILVGTQLIAKGHDFPGVTLVGVVSADLGLGLPDFRAAERTFQLLTQAAGRAGRGETPGRVLVQTFYPEHYAIRFAAQQNYEGFFAREMRFRRMMHYPPHTALANLIVQDANLERAAQVAKAVGEFLARVDASRFGVRVLGPGPAPLAKIEGRYRIQFLLKAASRARLNELLRQLLDEFEQRRIAPRSYVIDVDPVSIM